MLDKQLLQLKAYLFLFFFCQLNLAHDWYSVNVSQKEKRWNNVEYSKEFCVQLGSYKLHISFKSNKHSLQTEIWGLRGSFSSQLGQQHLVLPTLLVKGYHKSHTYFYQIKISMCYNNMNIIHFKYYLLTNTLYSLLWRWRSFYVALYTTWKRANFNLSHTLADALTHARTYVHARTHYVCIICIGIHVSSLVTSCFRTKRTMTCVSISEFILKHKCNKLMLT